MQDSGWIKWKSYSEIDYEKDSMWLLNFRIQTFKLILVISIFFLLVIVIRSFWADKFGFFDLGNAVVFIIIFILLSWKPKLFRLLAWLGLVALLVNTYDGLQPNADEVIVPSYILYPLLVLYGALLGDISITLVASFVILFVFGFTWIKHSPLQEYDFVTLTNLFLLVAGTGVSAITVLFLYQRLLKVVKTQAQDLHRELQNKFRLNALIFHDIINPLGIIDGTIDLIKGKAVADQEDIKTIDNMAKQIFSIIESARGMESGLQADMDQISLVRLFEELNKLFSSRLEKKELKFCFEGEKDLTVFSNFQIMLNSVLGNFLSNAIKFSPRGGTIIFFAEKEDSHVRFGIIDEGSGFPDKLLRCAEEGKKYFSQDGTEGEVGTAFGLMIASICMQNLNGSLEVRNTETGAIVSVVVPIRT